MSPFRRSLCLPGALILTILAALVPSAAPVSSQPLPPPRTPSETQIKQHTAPLRQTSRQTSAAALSSASRIRALSAGSAIRTCGATDCPPENDHFESAVVLVVPEDSHFIEGVQYAQTDDTDPMHPCRHASPGRGSATVWYTFVPAVHGFATISAASATYDTTMTLFTGAPGDFTTIRCNEDINVQNGVYQSEILYASVSAGTEYFVLVSAWDEEGLVGEHSLEVMLRFVESVPRPENDDFAAAEVIDGVQFGDIEPNVYLASLEATDPQVSCHSSGPSTGSNSVWYTYTPPSTGRATINTFGSTGSGNDTILALFTGGAGALTEVACNDDDSPFTYFSQVQDVLLFDSTTYYIYVARWWADPADAVGSFALNLEFTETLLSNSGFDLPTGNRIPAAWTRKGPGMQNDKNKCNASGSIVRSSPCAYVFKGDAGATSKLSQTLPAEHLTGLGVSAFEGGVFTAAAFINGQAASGSLMVKVKYADGKAGKHKVPFQAYAEYTGATASVVLNAPVKSVSVQLKNKRSTGKWFVDDVTLTYAETIRGNAGQLPPPPVPDGFRGSN